MTLRYVGCPGETWHRERTQKSGVKKGPLPASLQPINKSCKLYQVVNILGSRGKHSSVAIPQLGHRSNHRRESSIYRNRQLASMCYPLPCTGGQAIVSRTTQMRNTNPVLQQPDTPGQIKGKSTESVNPLRNIHSASFSEDLLCSGHNRQNKAQFLQLRDQWPMGEAALEMDMMGTFSSVSSSVTWT